MKSIIYKPLPDIWTLIRISKWKKEGKIKEIRIL